MESLYESVPALVSEVVALAQGRQLVAGFFFVSCTLPCHGEEDNSGPGVLLAASLHRGNLVVVLIWFVANTYCRRVLVIVGVLQPHHLFGRTDSGLLVAPQRTEQLSSVWGAWESRQWRVSSACYIRQVASSYCIGKVASRTHAALAQFRGYVHLGHGKVGLRNGAADSWRAFQAGGCMLLAKKVSNASF